MEVDIYVYIIRFLMLIILQPLTYSRRKYLFVSKTLGVCINIEFRILSWERELYFAYRCNKYFPLILPEDDRSNTIAVLVCGI